MRRAMCSMTEATKGGFASKEPPALPGSWVKKFPTLPKYRSVSYNDLSVNAAASIAKGSRQYERMPRSRSDR